MPWKQRRVPWRSVHPQTGHVHLDSNKTSTEFSDQCENLLLQYLLQPLDFLLLWHLDPRTIYYCDTLIPWQSTLVAIRLKVDSFSSIPNLCFTTKKIDSFSQSDISTYCNNLSSRLWHYVLGYPRSIFVDNSAVSRDFQNIFFNGRWVKPKNMLRSCEAVPLVSDPLGLSVN